MKPILIKKVFIKQYELNDKELKIFIENKKKEKYEIHNNNNNNNTGINGFYSDFNSVFNEGNLNNDQKQEIFSKTYIKTIKKI